MQFSVIVNKVFKKRFVYLLHITYFRRSLLTTIDWLLKKL